MTECLLADSSQLQDQTEPPLNPWYHHHFSRLLVDMHIPDWDSRFFSQLDGKHFAETVAKSRSGSLMLYCNSHVGLALYPSKIGPVHRAIGSGDFVKEVLNCTRKQGGSVVAYYSAVFNNAAFLDHPDWRIVPPTGPSAYEHSRYGTCCPNSPYRDFAIAQTEEICRTYAFDGIFFDMLFWPYLCYCPHCQARFQKEEGHALPRVTDWHHPVWMAFQRARERWMSELAGDLTAAVRRSRPSMTVTHQMSPVLHDWRAAMPYSITDHCDYASGDFYGPPVQQSVVCKIFETLSRRKPFEFMTSRCTNLRDHVTTKSLSQMEMHAFLAPAHAAAFMFIDAIDPTGTLNPAVYDRIGSIFSKMKPYEEFLGGELTADVAIYVSAESRFDFRDTGDVAKSSERSDNMATLFAGAHMTAVMGAAQSLQESHVPYAILTQRNLHQLSRYRAVVLPNVLVMSDAEIAAFREYVEKGGNLYASGYSSLVSETGQLRPDFGLADVFGVSASEGMQYTLAFLTPRDGWLSQPMTPQTQLIHRAGWISIHNRTATVLADLMQPWYPENEGTVLRPSFSSIHSTPPALEATCPAITRQTYGKGIAYYAAVPLEAEFSRVNRATVAGLIRELLGRPVTIEAEAPTFVEITVFHKAGQNRFNISLVSLRQEEEPIPCSGSVTVRLDSTKRLVALRALPSLQEVPVRSKADGVEFDFHDFQVFSMYELEYQNL